MDREPGTIFIHIDAVGARRGNGGFVMLSRLAFRLDQMGYQVMVFDPEDRLRPERWKVLSMDPPTIVSFDDVVSEVHTPVMTVWLHGILDQSTTRGLMGGINPLRIRYWCHDELLRDEMDAEREFAGENLETIAINNHTLEKYYRKWGYLGQILYIDNWIRPEFHQRSEKEPGLIGYQTDNNVFSIWDELAVRFGDQNLLLCEGTQLEVAEKMSRCEYFVHWDRHAACFSIMRGQSFGLSLFEAMASGCVCFSRRHDGILDLLAGDVPMYVDLENLFEDLEACIASDCGTGEKLRSQQVSLVESDFRFDDKRRKELWRWLG